MDFYTICTRDGKKQGDPPELYPDFKIGRSTDLMVRGRGFYAIWDEAENLWSTDEYDVQRLVDASLDAEAEKLQQQTGMAYNVRHLRSASSQMWYQFRKFMMNISDSSKQLDENLTFSNTVVTKNDYVSRRLPYALAAGEYAAWDELVGTLYSVEERAKIEWIIGAIVSGDSKKIHKFGVFYGPPGSGKSTILNIISKMFEGYVATFDAKALGSTSHAFATEVFKSNPLVAIQQDGDLSKIEDNARLNSIVSHEMMTMNEKYKAAYDARVIAFLLMGTNQPVKISDSKSGIIRRLIDIHPTGVQVPTNHYNVLMSQIDFELGAIAQHCLEVYREMGKNYYSNYKPVEMMTQTDVFYNFIEEHYDIFKVQDYTTLTQAYTLYKEFCSNTGIQHVKAKYQIHGDLTSYFDTFKERAVVDGAPVRSYYEGFNANRFKQPAAQVGLYSVVMDETKSLWDEEYADMPAQGYKLDPNSNEIPIARWSSVMTQLKDVDTSELHFVQIPKNHIIIDFDLKDEDGNKSLERNLLAASNFPSTYSEVSKSGEGVHLHYDYEGDVEQLASVYSEGIEIKTLLGNASLRRKLTKCNNVPVAKISTGLPIKEKQVHDVKQIQSEAGLRKLIIRALRKEVNNGTKPNIDFIEHILNEAQRDGLQYDVSDMKPQIIAFANNSSNQAMTCLRIVNKMKFQTDPDMFGEDPIPSTAPAPENNPMVKEERPVFFDIEVYPNLLVVCWKLAGDATINTMINPKPHEVEGLFRYKLVGYNNRRYDNHILYGAMQGFSNEDLYKLSKKMMAKDPNAMFGSAYNLSYADIYDFAATKQSLKKWEIQLGLVHKEMDIPWDDPVPEELIEKVVDYCKNDVVATEAVFEHLKPDFMARQSMAELAGMSVNETTRKLTGKIIFGDDRYPQSQFNWHDMGTKEFPGYKFEMGKSTYRDEVVGEGGYVYAEPGMYTNVALLDVASMHPTSIIQLDLFGKYTKNYEAIRDARIAIKKGDYDTARKMFGGRLAPFLEDESSAEALSYALKIVINSVYGYTSASFENLFKDRRNKDNIVAKRGALFMIDLKHFVQERGFTVAHIKTDSIKIPNATPEIIAEVTEFGKKWGYDFEHEATYEKFCLVNDAVYVAKKEGKDKWEAVGAQFQHPVVYRHLFANAEQREQDAPIEDYFETKQITKGAIYMDFKADREKDEPVPVDINDSEMKFVGRIGRFVPVVEGGSLLYRIAEVDGNHKKYAVAGTKGWRWIEADMYLTLRDQYEIDMTYFDKLVKDAEETLEKWGDVRTFLA